MSSEKVHKRSKFLKYMSALRKFYVHSLKGYAEDLSYGNAMSYPVPVIPTLPRSFSTNSSFGTKQDRRDLIRFTSARDLTGRTDIPRSVPRSKSVAIGRINERKPVEDEVGLLKAPGVFSRSKSHAVSSSSKMIMA